MTTSQQCTEEFPDPGGTIPCQIIASDRSAPAGIVSNRRRPRKPTVEKTDPRYFDWRQFPTPDADENCVEARLKQLAAIKARKAERRRLGSRDSAAWPLVEDIGGGAPLRERFPTLVPPKPYCTNDPKKYGMRIRPRTAALRHRHVQLNGPQCIVWLAFDIDRPGAYFAAEDGNLPPPNFIAVNPKNGHAHVAYLLAKPVHKFSKSRKKPLNYLAAIQRGLRRRLGADCGYSGLLTKNPLHTAWRVTWPCDKPYLLDELASWLSKKDMRREPKRLTSGLGRNCDCFDKTRQWAYGEVLRFKRSGSLVGWTERCTRVAAQHNKEFDTPLGCGEIRAIGKSVARWTWRKFTEETFSRRQASCGRRGLAKR